METGRLWPAVMAPMLAGVIVSGVVPFKATDVNRIAWAMRWPEFVRSMPSTMSLDPSRDDEAMDAPMVVSGIEKGIGAEAPPPGDGVLTVTATLPAFINYDPGATAVIRLAELSVVLSGAPRQFTTDELRKSLPVTVRSKVPPPGGLGGAS